MRVLDSIPRQQFEQPNHFNGILDLLAEEEVVEDGQRLLRRPQEVVVLFVDLVFCLVAAKNLVNLLFLLKELLIILVCVFEELKLSLVHFVLVELFPKLVFEILDDYLNLFDILKGFLCSFLIFKKEFFNFLQGLKSLSLIDIDAVNDHIDFEDKSEQVQCLFSDYRRLVLEPPYDTMKELGVKLSR